MANETLFSPLYSLESTEIDDESCIHQDLHEVFISEEVNGNCRDFSVDIYN